MNSTANRKTEKQTFFNELPNYQRTIELKADEQYNSVNHNKRLKHKER